MIARVEALARLRGERFDVVVVGGGITGAGVALDAASRGYRVALVERADYAAGTSSRSSKLIHGGLRYLQRFDLGLVREALLERQLMVALAPHLVRPLPLVVASFGRTRPDRSVGLGLNMYDVLAVGHRRGRRHAPRAGRGGGPGRGGGERRARDIDSPVIDPTTTTSWSPERHRAISGAEVRELLPALTGRNPSGGYLFYDCQTDDARLVLSILAEAERFGAVCANRVEAVELLERDGLAIGVQARDVISGERFAIRAGDVVNATGVWADRLRPHELYAEADVPRLRPSRGTHLTFAAADLPLVAGAVVPAGGGRTVFALPWLGGTLVGTTDNDYDGELEHVRPPDEDVRYLLDAVNEFFGRALGPSDVTGAFAGVRPLISSGDARKSVDISRKAELYETSSGMITITGGKLTTWRRMAKAAVDRIVERDGRDAPCRTHEIAIGMPIDPAALAPQPAVGAPARAALAARYGHAARTVLAIAEERPALADPILAGQPDLLAEAIHAVRHEQAGGLGDVLLRRTRLGLLAARAVCTPAVLGRLADVLGDELGWSASERRVEIARFEHEARAEGIVVDPH